MNNAITLDDTLSAACAAGLQLHEARMLLLHMLGRAGHERAWLLAHGSDAAPAGVPEALRRLIERRLAGEPVAYLTGKKAFYGLELQVNEHTLDPRPDTETLVDWALELLRKADAPAVLDLGCGSGAIALAIAAHCAAARVVATDASEGALAVARANAQRLGLNVQFLQGNWHNWFAPLAAGECFDLIVSNPPYIAESDPHLPALHCEPRCALAQSFHYGDMMTAVLGGEGRLLGKWGTPWSEDKTEQEPFVRLIRNLNAVRKKHGDLLLDGRMVVPPYAVETKPVAYDVDTKYYGIRHIETSEVIVSFWENDAGKRLGFATNWKAEPSEITIVHGDGSRETRTVPPCETIELDVGGSK